MALSKATRVGIGLIQQEFLETVDSLRNMQPRSSRDCICISGSIAGGQRFTEMFHYDESDTSTLDDGYSCIVNQWGNRWKANLSEGYNPLLLLGHVGYESLDLCINKIARDLAVKWQARKGVIDFCTTIKIPANDRGQSRYTLSDSIVIPGFVSLNFLATTYFDCYNNKDGIVIDNSKFPQLLDSVYSTDPADRPRSVLLWESERNVFTGSRVFFNHPIGSARTSNAAITIGNTVSGYIDVRGCTVSNFGAYGFYHGIKINPVDNYINTFRDGHLGRNNYAISVLGASKTNAGEKFVFDNMTLADSDSDLIYIENNAFELFFHACSLDYPTGDLVKITKDGNAYVSFNQCHIEGVQGMLVNVVAVNTFPKYGKRIVFTDCAIDLRSGQTTWNKTWFFSTVINTYVYIKDTNRTWPGTPTVSLATTAYQSLVVTGKPANNQVVVDYQLGDEDLLDASSVMIAQFRPGSNNKRVISTGRFDGNPGDAYATSVSAADAWGWYTVNGSWQYSEADADDGDGVKGITLTSDNASTKFYVMCNLQETASFQDKVRALGSIKIEPGYTGDVKVRAVAEVHALTRMNSTVVENVTIATTEGADTVVSSFAEANGRIGKYQGFSTQALQIQSFNNQTTPMAFLRCGMILTGFVGTIHLKLPTVTTHRRLSA